MDSMNQKDTYQSERYKQRTFNKCSQRCHFSNNRTRKGDSRNSKVNRLHFVKVTKVPHTNNKMKEK